MLVLPKKEHALVSRFTPATRLGAAEKLTALVLEKPNTPLSSHLASFSLTTQGLISLSLPSEHVLIDQKPTKPGRVFNFIEQYNKELSGWMVAWFLEMTRANQFIQPPCLFISSATEPFRPLIYGRP
jgi:hypothetical protein